MKIYILPVEKRFQPRAQAFRYPKHNKDFGVEQDFLEYLERHDDLATEDPGEADRHYLPVFWTRWHLNHEYGSSGREELQKEVDARIIDDAKTFTVCQYDDGPLADLGRARKFLSSRITTDDEDAPLLCIPHRRPFFGTDKKRYKASFIGRVDTHPMRRAMHDALKGRHDIFLFDGDKGERSFVRMMTQSLISLCPRGYGGSSFRFYESMQLGTVPLLFGDLDTRPFKEFLPWNEVSFFASSTDELTNIIDGAHEDDLLKMGERARTVYREALSYGRWCSYLVKTLKLQHGASK